jgi:hypothetical protein
MIEGVKMDINGSELKQRLAARIDYHRQRAEFFKKEAARVVETAGAGDDPIPNPVSNKTVNSVREDYSKQALRHRQRGGQFTFIMEHLSDKEVYRLTEADLFRLELVEGDMY